MAHPSHKSVKLFQSGQIPPGQGTHTELLLIPFAIVVNEQLADLHSIPYSLHINTFCTAIITMLMIVFTVHNLFFFYLWDKTEIGSVSKHYGVFLLPIVLI